MQISSVLPPSRPERGALAIVTDVGAGSDGRRCAFDEQRVKRTAKSCGPDAPMAGVKFLGSSRFLGATVTNKLWSRRGEHGISRKPLRREGRTASAEPVCSCAFLFATFAHGTAGAARTRSSLRPSFSEGRLRPSCFWGERICKPRAQRVARR